MPKRKTLSDSADRSDKRPSVERALTHHCPVCLDDFAAKDTTCFPCSHALCNTCYPKCDTCPMCRVDRNGTTDEARRVAQNRLEEMRVGRIVATRVPGGRVVGYVGGSGGTPFDVLTVHISNFSPSMNTLIEDIVSSVVESRNARGAPLSRGHTQQRIGEAIYRATRTQNTPRIIVRDIFGRPTRPPTP